MLISRIALACIACASVPLSAPCAETHRNEQLHFAVTVPPDWVPMSRSEVQAINNSVRALMPTQGVQYTEGFRPIGSTGFPYVLVQHIPMQTAGSTYQAIERALAMDMTKDVKRVKGELKDLVKDVSLEKPKLDRSTNRIQQQSTLIANEQGKINVTTAGMVGKDGIVYLHCYALEKDGAQMAQVYESFFNSFAYDPGYEFVEGKETLGPGFWEKFSRGTMQSILIGAVVGGSIGLLIYLVGYFTKRLRGHG